MLKRVQHDRKKCVIPNQVLNLIQDLRFRNLEFGNDNKSIVFALIIKPYAPDMVYNDVKE